MRDIPEDPVGPERSPLPLLLEIIVQSVEDARAAHAGGADRLEVVRDIDRGGLTPPIDLVRSLASETPLPLRVMLRESAGYGVADARELASLRRSMESLARLGVHGVVAGFLRGEEPDVETLRSVIAAAPGVHVTFHRAFDSVTDPIAAIRALGAVPQVDRILTAGGGGDIVERCRRLRAYSEAAGTRFTILAGGGIGEREVAALRASRAVREVHAGRAAREHGIASAPVSTRHVRRLRVLADGSERTGERRRAEQTDLGNGATDHTE